MSKKKKAKSVEQCSREMRLKRLWFLLRAEYCEAPVFTTQSEEACQQAQQEYQDAQAAWAALEIDLQAGIEAACGMT